MEEPVLQHQMTSRLEDLGPLARAVGQWCRQQRLPDAEASRLQLMLDELVTNTVVHGYRGREDGWIRIELRREGAWVHMTLSDAAPVFDPTTRPPRVHSADDDDVHTRPIGGLGVDFVRRLAQRWRHQALPGGGNRLQIWRRIGDTPPGR